MLIYAIDPGPETSCLIVLGAEKLAISRADDIPNAMLRQQLSGMFSPPDKARLVIEQVQNYGKPVGATVFETIFWSGRFAERWGGQEGVHWFRMSRPKVSGVLIGSAEIKKMHGAVVQRLIDIVGPKGTKKSPGPTYGISKHRWEALALAVAFAIRERLTEVETMERIM
jgi:hypothetical protein